MPLRNLNLGGFVGRAQRGTVATLVELAFIVVIADRDDHREDFQDIHIWKVGAALIKVRIGSYYGAGLDDSIFNTHACCPVRVLAAFKPSGSCTLTADFSLDHSSAPS